jgi:hypothetical protein
MAEARLAQRHERALLDPAAEAAASAARRLRPEVSKNSSTALCSNDGELARSIAICAPAMASLSPLPVIVLTPLLGGPATTS